MYYIMSWKWYLGMQLATMVSGALLGWSLTKWCEAYDEAKKAGVVA